MEQISQENDEEKLNQPHDNEVRSDFKTVNRFHKNPVAYQYVKLLDFCIVLSFTRFVVKYSLLLIGYDMILTVINTRRLIKC